MKNILITGGAGFIGSNLSLKLISKGYKITVLDSLSPQIHGDNPKETSPLYQSIKDKVKFIEGTVTSKEDWLKSFRRYRLYCTFSCGNRYRSINVQYL